MEHQGVVLHQGAIGDFVLSLAVVQAMRDVAPVDKITAIASASSARLAAGRSVVDAWMSPDVARFHTVFGEDQVDEALGKMLVEADWVLSFLGDEQAQVSHRLVEIAHGCCICIDPRPRTQTLQQRRHITDQWADNIRQQGIALSRPTPPRIRMSERVPPHPRILIHPGSGGREKCWPFERFLELADALRQPVSWLLGPAEQDRQPDWVLRLRTRVTEHHEQLFIEEDLVDAASHIASSRLFIGNDAGMTHVAAALGVPTVAIFGSTDPRVWRPLNENVKVVGSSDQNSVLPVAVEEVLKVVRTIPKRS